MNNPQPQSPLHPQSRPTSRSRCRCTLWLAWVFLTLAPSSALAESVILTLKNGDRISGTLVSESKDRVVLRSPNFGKLKVPADQISTRDFPERPKPAPAIAVTPPPANAPKVPTPESPASSPKATAAPTSVPVAQTNRIAQTRLQRLAPDWLDPFMTNWHGNIQVGLDLGYGTADRQTYYANGSATHAYGRIRNFADLRASYGFVNEIQSAERIDGSWKLDVDMGQKRRIYVYNQAGGGYDRIRKLDIQYQEGVGLGYKILQQPKRILSVEAGGQYQFLDYSDASLTADRSILSLRLGESFTWSIAGKLNLTHRAAFMPNLENFNDFRFRFELGLSYPLFKRMTLNLNLLDDYDSSPPLGVDKNELQLQSTLGYTF